MSQQFRQNMDVAAILESLSTGNKPPAQPLLPCASGLPPQETPSSSNEASTVPYLLPPPDFMFPSAGPQHFGYVDASLVLSTWGVPDVIDAAYIQSLFDREDPVRPKDLAEKEMLLDSIKAARIVPEEGYEFQIIRGYNPSMDSLDLIAKELQNTEPMVKEVKVTMRRKGHLRVMKKTDYRPDYPGLLDDCSVYALDLRHPKVIADFKRCGDNEVQYSFGKPMTKKVNQKIEFNGQNYTEYYSTCQGVLVCPMAATEPLNQKPCVRLRPTSSRCRTCPGHGVALKHLKCDVRLVKYVMELPTFIDHRERYLFVCVGQHKHPIPPSTNLPFQLVWAIEDFVEANPKVTLTELWPKLRHLHPTLEHKHVLLEVMRQVRPKQTRDKSRQHQWSQNPNQYPVPFGMPPAMSGMSLPPFQGMPYGAPGSDMMMYGALSPQLNGFPNPFGDPALAAVGPGGSFPFMPFSPFGLTGIPGFQDFNPFGPIPLFDLPAFTDPSLLPPPDQDPASGPPPPGQQPEGAPHAAFQPAGEHIVYPLLPPMPGPGFPNALWDPSMLAMPMGFPGPLAATGPEVKTEAPGALMPEDEPAAKRLRTDGPESLPAGQEIRTSLLPEEEPAQGLEGSEASLSDSEDGMEFSGDEKEPMRRIDGAEPPPPGQDVGLQVLAHDKTQPRNDSMVFNFPGADDLMALLTEANLAPQVDGTEPPPPEDKQAENPVIEGDCEAAEASFAPDQGDAKTETIAVVLTEATDASSRGATEDAKARAIAAEGKEAVNTGAGSVMEDADPEATAADIDGEAHEKCESLSDLNMSAVASDEEEEEDGLPQGVPQPPGLPDPCE